MTANNLSENVDFNYFLKLILNLFILDKCRIIIRCTYITKIHVLQKLIKLAQ